MKKENNFILKIKENICERINYFYNENNINFYSSFSMRRRLIDYLTEEIPIIFIEIVAKEFGKDVDFYCLDHKTRGGSLITFYKSKYHKSSSEIMKILSSEIVKINSDNTDETTIVSDESEAVLQIFIPNYKMSLSDMPETNTETWLLNISNKKLGSNINHYRTIVDDIDFINLKLINEDYNISKLNKEIYKKISHLKQEINDILDENFKNKELELYDSLGKLRISNYGNLISNNPRFNINSFKENHRYNIQSSEKIEEIFGKNNDNTIT